LSLTKWDDVPSSGTFRGKIVWLSGGAAHRPSRSRHHVTKSAANIAKAKNKNDWGRHELSRLWHRPGNEARVYAPALPIQSPVKMWPG